MTSQKLNIDNINQKAKNLGLSPANISKELGVSREAVSKWLNDESMPRPGLLLKLATLLGLTFNEIVIDPKQKPIFAFRKTASSKTTEEHRERATDMGKFLDKLTSKLPFDSFSQPATLINPKNDYSYIQAVVLELRKKISPVNDCIDFKDLIGFFNDLHAILIPVLWGSQKQHENAMHIYLPDSKTSWVYLNLDSKLFDFKFWMAHELGHIKAIELSLISEEESELFADNFAGALLYPKQLSEQTYFRLQENQNIMVQIDKIRDEATKYVISPITIIKEVNKFAKNSGLPIVELEKVIYPITHEFNSSFLLVSESIFESNKPEPKQYVEISSQIFGSTIFDLIKSYLKENSASPGFLNRLLNIHSSDAVSLYEELVK